VGNPACFVGFILPTNVFLETGPLQCFLKAKLFTGRLIEEKLKFLKRTDVKVL
jgi:hypothetical protein